MRRQTNKCSIVSIVMPAVNEERAVSKAISSIPLDILRNLCAEVEIIVVDNGSTDGTAEQVLEAGGLLIREPRKGYGQACLTGFKAAQGDIIVMLDADGTYPPEDIPGFAQILVNDKADLVIGTRLKGKIAKGSMPFLHRYIGVPLLTFILRMLFGVPVSDAHCGMRAITRAALESLRLHADGFEFATEMLISAKRSNLRIVEVPIDYHVRTGSRSKLRSFRDGARHLWLMLRSLDMFAGGNGMSIPLSSNSPPQVGEGRPEIRR